MRVSINVWAEIYGDQIIGPFLFEENLNGNRYLEFLNNEFQEYLSNIPLDRLRRIWFQQDGAPPHNTRAVKEFLNQEFPQRWIGNGGFIAWPARSHDLSPLDFYLRGALKNLIYKSEINSLEDLKIRIRNAFRIISSRSVQRTVNKISTNIDKCILVNGNLFEHL